MRDKTRGRLLEIGSYYVVGAIAVGALGHCLLGTCLTGAGTAQAAGSGPGTPPGKVVPQGPARTSAAIPPAGAGKSGAKTPTKAGKTVARDFEISGMFCSSCVGHISSAVGKVPGVKKVEIDYESGRGSITYEEGKVDPAKLVEAIKKAGYKARPAG